MSEDHQRKQRALEILVNSVRVAQKRGAYSLEEASLILGALNEFTENTQSLNQEHSRKDSSRRTHPGSSSTNDES